MMYKFSHECLCCLLLDFSQIKSINMIYGYVDRFIQKTKYRSIAISNSFCYILNNGL